VAAATRIYTTGNLKPIHDGCNCLTMPIVGGNDPGDALNRLDMGQIYDDANTTDGWTLKQTRYVMGTDGHLEAVKTRKKDGPREPLAKIQKRAKQRADGVDTARPKAGGHSKPKGLEDMTVAQLQHQLTLTEGLKESDWRTQQLARIRAALQAKNS
jgi:hypothetical protein